MPSETQWQQQVAKALEDGVKNRDWWLRIEVVDPPDDEDEELDRLVALVNEWLAGLDPDDVASTGQPQRWEWPPGTTVRLRITAEPKEPGERGTGGVVAKSS
jgi:hypothetical protein